MNEISDRLARNLTFGRLYWPHIRFYDKQREMIESVQLNRETFVVAGNQLGKDYVAAYIALTFFLRPQLYFDPEYVAEIEKWRRPGQKEYQLHTTKVISTSVKEEHLINLWGEIGTLATTSATPLMDKHGGPLIFNERLVRWGEERFEANNPLCYLKGMVSASGEGFSGAHAAYTLLIVDEASAVDENVYIHSQGWAKKILAFGNPWPCAKTHWFRKGIEGGDIKVA